MYKIVETSIDDKKNAQGISKYLLFQPVRTSGEYADQNFRNCLSHFMLIS